MADLIDRRAALDIIDSELNGWLTDDERFHLEGVAIGIACLPSIDPVKHGRWIAKRDGWNGGFVVRSVCFAENGMNSKFCPHCGARMDGEE